MIKQLGLIVTAGLIWAIPTQAHVEVVVITMTANGFEPRQITVDDDTTINFVNKDTVPRWPASNVHPTHQLYSDFDPKRAIEPGDFWIFKPTKAGTWKYHDHLKPHQRATITVTAKDGTDIVEAKATFGTTLKNFFKNLWQGIIKPFRGRGNSTAFSRPSTTTLDPVDFQALAEQEQYDYLQQLSESNGLTVTWEYVKSTYTNDAGAALGGRAHDLAHFTGELIHNNAGLNALSLCDTTFAFGCYHGFTEAAFATSLEPLQAIAQACGTIGAVNSGPWASCIHGIGHGVATYFDAVELDNALATCDKITGEHFCQDGVFMEFSFSAPPNFYQADDPLYPCTTLDEKYLQACGRNQPHVMQRKFKMNRTQIADTCQQINHLGMIDACIDAIGFGIANESQGNPQAITAQCGELNNPAVQAHCVSAAAGELVFQNYPNWQQISPTLCNNLAPEFQPQCFDRVNRTAQNYSR